MSTAFNVAHVVQLMIVFPIIHAQLSAVADRDIVAALLFNLSLIIISSGIAQCSDQLAQAKRLGLWICYSAFTAPILYVCVAIAQKSKVTAFQVVFVVLGYAVMPLSYLGYLSLEGFLTYLED
jgi:hypothetical protein